MNVSLYGEPLHERHMGRVLWEGIGWVLSGDTRRHLRARTPRHLVSEEQPADAWLLLHQLGADL